MQVFVESIILNVNNIKLLKDLKVEISRIFKKAMEDFTILAYGTKQDNWKIVHIKLKKQEDVDGIAQLKEDISNLYEQVSLWDSTVIISGKMI